jgi:glucose 1-dehydrogenase
MPMKSAGGGGNRMGIDRKLAGKLALVTGAGTGIGREVALEFARQGAHVALHYAHSAEGATSAAEEILRSDGQARAFGADLQHVDAAIELVDRAVDFLGGIDLIVNNAGITYNKPFSEMRAREFDLLFHVNVRAQYFITQRALPHMLERGGGAIVNMTSIHGLQGAPEHSAYAATKGAIIAWTRQLGIELAHRGIRINAIAPGWIEVPNHYKAVDGYNPLDAKDSLPIGRAGRPLDIAKLAAFLCSSDADFIIGQTIVADGGTTSLMSLVDDFRTRSTAKFGADYVQ